MPIELPSKPDILDERLALLEDANLAERLIRENPALFAQGPPQTQREILAWTTRSVGTALIAVTAALSLAAGYVGSELARARAATPNASPRAAAAVLPRHHAPPPARPHAVPHAARYAAPRAIVSLDAAPAHAHASAPIAAVGAAQHHAVRALPLASPAHRAVAVHLSQAAHAAAPVHLRMPAAAPQSAAAQLASWEAVHPAAHARSAPATATQPVPSTASNTEPAAVTTASGAAPDSAQAGAPKTPPTSPGGVWTERIPGGGTLGGGSPQAPGVPRDSCTPRGGRTGIVMEAISILMSSRH